MKLNSLEFENFISRTFREFWMEYYELSQELKVLRRWIIFPHIHHLSIEYAWTCLPSQSTKSCFNLKIVIRSRMLKNCFTEETSSSIKHLHWSIFLEESFEWSHRQSPSTKSHRRSFTVHQEKSTENIWFPVPRTRRWEPTEIAHQNLANQRDALKWMHLHTKLFQLQKLGWR